MKANKCNKVNRETSITLNIPLIKWRPIKIVCDTIKVGRLPWECYVEIECIQYYAWQ